MAQHLIDYFIYSKSTLNFTQNYILKALQCNKLLSSIRALGIISKKITEPYLYISSDETLTAIEMGSIYQRLIDILQLSSQNPSLLLKNEISLTFGPFLPLCAVSESLFKISNIDSLTSEYIGKLCKCLKDKCCVLFKDFLEDGKFFNPSESLINDTKYCPPNNITVERLMGKLDSQLNSAPTSNISSIENRILFRNNNTSDWLNLKSTNKQKEIINSARIQNQTVMKTSKERKRIIYEEHVNIMNERKRTKKLRLEKRDLEKGKVLQNMKQIGIWENEEKIRLELSKFKTKTKRIQALKTQIHMLKEETKTIIKDKQLLQFSCKGKQHDEDTLICNIVQLLALIRTETNDEKTDFANQLETHPHALIGIEIKHIWENKNSKEQELNDKINKEQEWNGKILSYNSGVFKVVMTFDSSLPEF